MHMNGDGSKLVFVLCVCFMGARASLRNVCECGVSVRGVVKASIAGAVVEATLHDIQMRQNTMEWPYLHLRSEVLIFT